MCKREEHDQPCYGEPLRVPTTKDIAPVLREQIHRFVRAASYVHATGQVCDLNRVWGNGYPLLAFILFKSLASSVLYQEAVIPRPVSALKLLFARMSLRFTGGQQHTAIGLAKFSPKSWKHKHKHGAAGNTCAMLVFQ